VQERSRSMTTADVAKGIDLRKLALDTSKIPVPDGDGLAPEQIEDFVNGFFDALDASNEYDENEIADDGSSDRPSDDELAVLNAEAGDDNDDPGDASNVVEVADSTLMEAAVAVAELEESLGHDQGEPTDEELAAMMDDYVPVDDSMMDEAEMLDAMEEPPTFSSDAPILDLSVLEKPLRQKDTNA
jgi:type IV secretion system protein VirD4